MYNTPTRGLADLDYSRERARGPEFYMLHCVTGKGELTQNAISFMVNPTTDPLGFSSVSGKKATALFDDHRVNSVLP
jgi:hypothetical protein